MSRNEIILSNRLVIDDIKSGAIDYLIRIGTKNKWTIGTVFELKTSHTENISIPINILSSEQIPVKDIPVSLLSRCGYRSQEEFKSQWEEWYQAWDDISEAWLIHFEPYTPLKDIEYDDIFA